MLYQGDRWDGRQVTPNDGAFLQDRNQIHHIAVRIVFLTLTLFYAAIPGITQLFNIGGCDARYTSWLTMPPLAHPSSVASN